VHKSGHSLGTAGSSSSGRDGDDVAIEWWGRADAIARVVHNNREPPLADTVQALIDAKYGWSDGLKVELTPA